jgi:ElaB/YqjD/DUF883 family membrane-anchored ribosome-binding protein
MVQARKAHDESPATDRLATLAHGTVDRVSSAASEAEQQVRGAAAQVAEQTEEIRDNATRIAQRGVKQARTYVKQNPLLAAGIAFAAGIVLRSLLRR